MSDVSRAAVPRNNASASLKSSIKLPGSIVVYGFTITNTNAAAQYFCMFDADTLPADGAVPLISKGLPAHDAIGFWFGVNGRRFDAGLVLCNSSTDSAKTIGSADCLFDVQYDELD